MSSISWIAHVVLACLKNQLGIENSVS